MAKDVLYSCSAAAGDLRRALDALDRVGVLVPAAGITPQDAGRFVHSCQPCEKGVGASKCLGWRVTIPRGRPLVLGDFSYGGRRLHIEVEVDCDFRRTAPMRPDGWRSCPAGAADFGVMIYDAYGDGPKSARLIERHHVDLANRNQVGPVWHLQFGGNPPDGSLPTGWLDPPRWAVLPVDTALLLDAVIYNFRYELWNDLHSDPTWQMVVKRSEDLMLSCFADVLSAHMVRDARARKHTLMQVIDNKSQVASKWDPRPA